MFSKATSMVHHWLSTHVADGDLVVDATCGNGHDTLMLAHLVGSGGHVISVDIQESAISNTGQRLKEEGLLNRVSLHHMSHERILEVLGNRSVHCAVFNLGYLPGGDKSLVTVPESTIVAHERLLSRLSPGGVIITTVYTGHVGGPDEAEALFGWANKLDGKHVVVARHEWVNLEGQPPHILLIQRRPSSSS